MAYFSNGTEGGILDEQCAECSVADHVPCPVLWVQMEYNYKQHTDGEKNIVSEVLNCLVNEKGQCQMKVIIDNNLVNKKQMDLF